MRRQYERWPYPSYPLLASVPRRPLWQIHHAYLAHRCGVAAVDRPRIWIAGCGTFQPHVFAKANPDAEILATDWSRRSLATARRRCLWHGHGNVRLGQCNLDDLTALPEGPFDAIECYGVLMCLADPLATLRALADRLAPQGVLRLMVYPTYSRHRVFQIQQLARDFDLSLDHADSPRRLRQLIAHLPTWHPLRYAFDSYTDARTDAGLVDGFLHASDRGFTGRQLGALTANAGLEAGAWHHRDFADPRQTKLELGYDLDTNEFEFAHQLDLWQELRGNFVVCLRKAMRPPTSHGLERLHPHLNPRLRGLHWFERAGLVAARGLGRSLPDALASDPSRRHVRIRAKELRALDRGQIGRIPTDRLLQLQARGIWLTNDPGPTPDSSRRGCPLHGLDRLDPPAPPGTNPLYAALFAAWLDAAGTGTDRVESLRTCVQRWAATAEPLESARVPFGLTPIGTYHTRQVAIDEYLRRDPVPPDPDRSAPEPVEHGPDLERRRDAVRRWCRRTRSATPDLSDAARVQRLWHTLCNAHDLFDPAATRVLSKPVTLPANQPRPISRSDRGSATPTDASRPA